MSKARAPRELGFCPDEDRSNSPPRDSPVALRVPSVCPFISRTTRSQEARKHQLRSPFRAVKTPLTPKSKFIGLSTVLSLRAACCIEGRPAQVLLNSHQRRGGR